MTFCQEGEYSAEEIRFGYKEKYWVKELTVSISRIGEVQARPESTEKLREFLISILPIIKASRGCESVQLYQNHEDPSKFIMIEVWDSIESHQASVENIPAEKLGEIRPLLATSPSGGYFGLVEQA